MPNVTIYVSQDLADAIRRNDVEISRTCQVALRRAARLSERRRGGDELAIAVHDGLKARHDRDRNGAA